MAMSDIYVGYTCSPRVPEPVTPFDWSLGSALLLSRKMRKTICMAVPDKAAGTGFSVAAAVRDWLVAERSHARSLLPSSARGNPSAVLPPPRFYGFNPRHFLRILAASCAICGGAGRVPFSIDEAVAVDLSEWLPAEKPAEIMASLAPTIGRVETYNQRVAAWAGPGVSAPLDAYMAQHLSVFLGLSAAGEEA